MNYSQVMNYIDLIERFGSKPGLERLKNLLKRLGNPEKSLKVIHVAGTNGKGSTVSMLESILGEAGYEVGTYTSPHLESYNERMKINHVDISDIDFATIGEQVIKMSKICQEEDGEHPTAFECLTAMALLYFYTKSVDYVILEVGLGGRLDATNVIEKPVISVITSIGMDHMDVLGNTIEEIAREKAGIIKKNCSTVLYFPNNQVYNIIKDICENLNSHLYYISNIDIKYVKHNIDSTIFSIKTNVYSYDRLEIRLIGEHQLYNAALVLLAVEALRNQGLTIHEEHIKKGLKKCSWPGRMEIVSKDPIVLLDGAHNEEGAVALANAIKQYFANKKITLLIGVFKDKPYKKMLEKLLPLVHAVVLTEPNSPRKLLIDELEEAVRQYPVPIYKHVDNKRAFELALDLTDKNEVLCCAGSLHLIGELKTIINRRS